METGTTFKNEKERLAALHRYKILDTEEEQDFNDIVALASQLCNSAVSVITLVDKHRQWFKAKIGWEFKETHRNISFCSHTIQQTDLLEIKDTTKDNRFVDNPLVRENPKIRFYAGMPLITHDGYGLGTLAVIDPKPQKLNDQQRSSLRILAKQIITMLDLRVNNLQLKQTNEKINYLANLVEQTGDAIISINADSIIKSWNHGAQILYGYAPEKVIGRPLREFVRSYNGQTNNDVEKIINEKKIWRGEVAHLHKNNTIIHALVSISPIAGLNDKEDYFVLQLRDISERKILENQLQKTNLELEKSVAEKTKEIGYVFERVSDAFVALDNKGNCTYINEKAAHILNRSGDYLIGKNVWTEFQEILNEASGISFRAATQAAIESQKHQYNELYYASLDRWLENNIYPSATGLSIYFKDITKKKKAELAIKHGDQVRKLIMHAALDAIVCTDMVGAITVWNPQAEKIFGWNYDEVVGKKMAELIIPQQYRERHEKGMDHYLKTGEGPILNKIFQITALNKAQKEFPVELTISPIDQDDSKFFCAFIKDITARKRAEFEMLKEKELSDSIINSMPGIFYLFDETGKLIRWNKQLEIITGYTSEEICEVQQVDFVRDTDKENVKSKINGILSKGVSNTEGVLHTKNGTKIPFYFTKAKVEIEGKTFLLGTGIDITERKKVEQALSRSESLFRRVFESKMVGFMFWNAQGHVTSANDRLLEIIGYTKRDLEDQKIKWSEITPPEYAHKDAHGLKQIALTGICEPFEKEYIHKDGTRIPILIGAASIEEGNGEKGVAYITDITQRKKIENEILQINERFKLITRATNDVIWDWDLVSNDLWWSETFYSLFGYERVNYSPDINSWYEGIHPADKERVVSKIQAAMKASQSYWADEYRFLKADGSIVDILDRGYIIYDSEGKPARMVGAMMDIAERKKSEESLRQAEEQYRNIFENTKEGIYQSTADGQFITANPSMANMFGYDSPDDLINTIKNIATDIFADPQERLRMMVLIKNNGMVNAFEFKALKKNKNTIWVKANTRAIQNADGSIRYFEGTMEDITDRKIAEDKLKNQFEELQKTNYELDRFVYSVSHDLRAPLASILGIVNISENEHPTPAHKKYLEMIRISVNRLDGFVKEILDYSRNNRTEVASEKIRFHELIDETLNSLKMIQGTDRLKVSIEINDTVKFYSDRTRLGIILNNILSNSIKYQDYRKELSLLSVDIITSMEKAVITVTDNGKGIEEKYLDKIFNMFYRASDVSGGSGLGLYITKETINKLGGDLHVTSKFGAFTTFEIVIPNSYRNL